MPKELTHWIVADEAFHLLHEESPLKILLHSHYSSYLIGAVLPDTLMHLIRGEYASIALQLAENFHNTNGNSFEPLVILESRAETGIPPEAFACMLGVVTHICSDISFHPFVYAMAGVDIGEHYAIETALDCYFCDNGKIPPIKRLGDIMSANAQSAAVTLLSLIFDPKKEMTDKILIKTVQSHAFIQYMYNNFAWKVIAKLLSLFPSPFLRQKQKLFYPFRRGSLNHLVHTETWRHPSTCEVKTETADKILQSAVVRSADIFCQIESAGMKLSPLEKIKGENLLTGVYGRGR